MSWLNLIWRCSSITNLPILRKFLRLYQSCFLAKCLWLECRTLHRNPFLVALLSNFIEVSLFCPLPIGNCPVSVLILCAILSNNKHQLLHFRWTWKLDYRIHHHSSILASRGNGLDSILSNLVSKVATMNDSVFGFKKNNMSIPSSSNLKGKSTV